MKDIQGIQRGKCNSSGCECDEYRTASSDGQTLGAGSAGGKLRCEYCDHTPAQHVKIIELGECRTCGKDNCEKYEFEDPNSYSDCAYCGCSASQHTGAETLRKPQAQQSPAASVAPGQLAGSAAGAGFIPTGFQPRLDALGQPAQLPDFGKCGFPGCSFPKRVEGNVVYDFCSRTCAKNFSLLQMQATAATKLTPGSTVIGPGSTQTSSLLTHSQGPPIVAMPSTVAGTGGGYILGGQPLPLSSVSATCSKPNPTTTSGTKLCTKCGAQPANPGRAWCQRCFQSSSSS